MKMLVASIIVFALISAHGALWTNDVSGVRWISQDRDRFARIESVRLIEESSRASVEKVKIPCSLNGFPVREIARAAFLEQGWIRSVTIHGGVRQVRDKAFAGCSNLLSVVLEGGDDGREGVVAIGEQAFMGCSKLSSVKLPKSLTSIHAGAFLGCSGLKEIELPGNLLHLGEGAFELCLGLQKISLPPMLALEDNPFMRCSGLQMIEVDPVSRNLKVKEGVLYSQDGTVLITYPPRWVGEAFTIPEGVEEIASFAFANAKELKEVRLPSTLRAIGTGAFCESGLRHVEIPNRVRALGEAAFAASALTNAVVGTSVEFVGQACFAGCTELKMVRFKGAEPHFENDVFTQSDCRVIADRESLWKIIPLK